ncbi:hypothetical protein A7U60_g9022 [Sanghuangporus baumii]|uniref:Uncharacterized protein n=1 Tax=Sanghuangporus baumii TaxID=108892 RepID=A0A9Q5HQW1_SANBA|nr:hypothetical protein A7U60_g9022 [Sanghuangporus baumii]
MEVDILSPQMRIRSVSSSNKRARSPGSPSPLERASKRTMISQLQYRKGVNQEEGGADRRWSRYEDEWVHQTQGMTIHSPALSEGDHLSTRSGEADEDFDEDARVDVQMTSLEDSASRHTLHEDLSTPRPQTHPPDIQGEDLSMTSPTSSQQQLDSHSHSHPNLHFRSLEPGSTDLPSTNEALNSLHALLDTPRSHRTDSTYTNTNNNTARPPKITLHPATPSTPTDGPRLAFALSLSQPSTPPPSLSLIANAMPPSMEGDQLQHNDRTTAEKTPRLDGTPGRL